VADDLASHPFFLQALLPLLYNTLPHLQHSLFLSTAFLSIAALEPAL
jgi:hypothetical protein